MAPMVSSKNKPRIVIWLSALAAAALATRAAEPALIPAEDFARAPQYENMQISPDGSCISYIVTRSTGSGVGFLDLNKNKSEVMMFGDRTAARVNAVYGYQWISAKRVVLFTSRGWVAANRDFSTSKYLTGYGRWSEETFGRAGLPISTIFDPSGIVPVAQRDRTELLVLNTPDYSNLDFRPDVWRLNSVNGSFSLVEKNPGNVRVWGADWDGNVRFGIIDDAINSYFIHRASSKQPWSTPIELGNNTVAGGIASLDANDRTLYLFKQSPGGFKALYSYDLVEEKFTGPLFQLAKHDVSWAIFSPKYRRLLGVHYTTDGPRQRWFEPEFEKIQKEIDAANPGVVNEIVSMDWDLQRLVVLSRSDREPGYYTLVELGTGKTTPLAQTRPWLKAAAMAEMFPIQCKARDGFELNGYLTLPSGRGRKNLPLVTLVHGGPFGIRDEWGFDPIVQFLASRGYAVLQPNYRGSGGYGEKYYLAGRHEIGGAIQNDIVDMTQWAVQQGIADSRRLAIMGGSYGGYSTLFALAKTPDVFRCGIAFAAVSDWSALFNFWHNEHAYSRDSLRYWSILAGDMKDPAERERLAAASPANFAASIKAPLLIVHGDDDMTVPIDQAHLMASALKKAGHPAETLYIAEVGHWWPTEKKGAQFLQRIESFLAAALK